ncbi:Modification methylase PvuII [Methanocorpusculaceae archaeon Sp1]|nr:Modification methylase PvuII [Methanocorpusculaceae archaeon Sp1]
MTANKKYLMKTTCGDCLDVLKGIETESIDMIITSPPYADLRRYKVTDTEIFAGIKPDEYVSWFLPIAEELYRILKPTGNFILNISDKTVGKFQHLYVFDLILQLCDENRENAFHLVRDYIWFNPATPPNAFSSGKFGRTKKSHEYCFWLCKGDNWTFNMDAIRRPYSDAMNTYLKGQGKGNRKHNTRPSTYSFDCEKIWVDKGGADPGTILHIEEPYANLDEAVEEWIREPGDVIIFSNTGSKESYKRLYNENIKHPARFPEKLVEFFIKAGSNEKDVILDPFMGSGTTAVVAEQLNRSWIGIELSKEYVELSKIRILEERDLRENQK